MAVISAKYSIDLCKRVCAAMSDRRGRRPAEIAASFDLPVSVAYQMWKDHRDPSVPVSALEPREEGASATKAEAGKLARTDGAPLDHRQVLEAFANRGSKSVDALCAELRISRSWFYRLVSSERAREGLARHRTARSEVKEAPAAESFEIAALREERDRLRAEAAALRQTVVLLGKMKE